MKRLISLFVLFNLSVQGIQAVSVQELIDTNQLPQVTGPAKRRVLDLSNLNITSLEGLQNVPNKNVHVLILNQNKLKIIPANAFPGFTQLEALGLRFNQLHDIEPGAFAGLSNLKVIRLGENKLKSIKKGVLEDLPKLSFLGLAANPIQRATRSNIKKLAPKAHVFYQPFSAEALLNIGLAVALVALAIAAGVVGKQVYEEKKTMKHITQKLVALSNDANKEIEKLQGEIKTIQEAPLTPAQVRIPLENRVSFLTTFATQTLDAATYLNNGNIFAAIQTLQQLKATLDERHKGEKSVKTAEYLVGPQKGWTNTVEENQRNYLADLKVRSDEIAEILKELGPQESSTTAPTK